MAFTNLKSEEEVKEYLKNLGTEYRFGCYSEKKPEGESYPKFHNLHLFCISLHFYSLSFTRRFSRSHKEGLLQSRKSI